MYKVGANKIQRVKLSTKIVISNSQRVLVEEYGIIEKYV
jgi:hypothetical protein